MTAYAYEIKRHDGAVIRGVCIAQNLYELFWGVDRWCDPSDAVYWRIFNPSFSANWVAHDQNTDSESISKMEVSIDDWFFDEKSVFFSLESSGGRFRKIKPVYVPSLEPLQQGGEA